MPAGAVVTWCTHSKPVFAGAFALGVVAIASLPLRATVLVAAEAVAGPASAHSTAMRSPMRAGGVPAMRRTYASEAGFASPNWATRVSPLGHAGFTNAA